MSRSPYVCPAFAGMPAIAGIINLTPDSFSGDLCPDPVALARVMLAAGASMLDLGAESTRPGSQCVPADVETARLIPSVRAIRDAFPDAVISVDTRKAAVADAALFAGADLVNDVSGLQYDPAMADTVAKHDAGLILMHMRGVPDTMQAPENLRYGDLFAELLDFFTAAADRACAAGVRRNAIWLDPGIGFSKDTAQNLDLIRHPERFRSLGLPLYYGISRKRFIGELTGVTVPAERDAGTAGLLAYLALCGVDAVRVHNVPSAFAAMRMASILREKDTDRDCFFEKSRYVESKRTKDV